MVNVPLTRGDGKLRASSWVGRQIGVDVFLQEADEDLGRDAAADRVQSLYPSWPKR